MKIVYIAHPVSGDVNGNIIKIISIVREINMMCPEMVPLVPYLADLYALDDNVPNERQRGIKNDIAVLKSGLINEVWLYGDKISTGMQEEIKLAKELNIPIKAMSKETKILFKPK